jgi:hypothetical protein
VRPARHRRCPDCRGRPGVGSCPTCAGQLTLTPLCLSCRGSGLEGRGYAWERRCSPCLGTGRRSARGPSPASKALQREEHWWCTGGEGAADAQARPASPVVRAMSLAEVVALASANGCYPQEYGAWWVAVGLPVALDVVDALASGPPPTGTSGSSTRGGGGALDP